MVITEAQLRAQFSKSGEKELVMEPGTILTTAAKDYIREQKIELISRASSGCAAKDQPSEKPEDMTHLRGTQLVQKNHPRIIFRGCLDHLQALIMVGQCTAEQEYPGIVSDLDEILDFVREILRCEVLEESFGQQTLLGLTQQQLREYSHHPDTHFGIRHFVPDYRMGAAMAQLNLIRTSVRQTELAAVEAFPSGERTDLICALNRLSSAVYILECRLLAAIKKERGQQPWMKDW